MDGPDFVFDHFTPAFLLGAPFSCECLEDICFLLKYTFAVTCSVPPAVDPVAFIKTWQKEAIPLLFILRKQKGFWRTMSFMSYLLYFSKCWAILTQQDQILFSQVKYTFQCKLEYACQFALLLYSSWKAYISYILLKILIYFKMYMHMWNYLSHTQKQSTPLHSTLLQTV